MVSHYGALGFRIEGPEGLKSFTLRAANSGREIRSPHGWYQAWSPGEGVELWVAMRNDGVILNCNPYFAGKGQIDFRVEQLMTDPPIYAPPLEGGLYGWAAATQGDPRSGLCPLLVDMPDFDLERDTLRLPSHLTVRVAAFAHWLDCFSHEDEYVASQAATPGSRKFSAEFFSPSGLFVPRDQPNRPAQALANFAGHVLETRMVTNPATNLPFHHIVVKSAAGTFDVVAEPTIPSAAPTVGGVVHGEFWLSARILRKQQK